MIRSASRPELLWLPSLRLRALCSGLGSRLSALVVGLAVALVVARLAGFLVAGVVLALQLALLLPDLRESSRRAERRVYRQALSDDASEEAEGSDIDSTSRDRLLVDLGYELERWRQQLLRRDQGAGCRDRRGRNGRTRVLEILAALHAPGEVALAEAALSSPDRVALGLAYLASLADHPAEQRIVVALDETRSVPSRVQELERALQELGGLPRRSHPRLIWVAPIG